MCQMKEVQKAKKRKEPKEMRKRTEEMIARKPELREEKGNPEVGAEFVVEFVENRLSRIRTRNSL